MTDPSNGTSSRNLPRRFTEQFARKVHLTDYAGTNLNGGLSISGVSSTNKTTGENSLASSIGSISDISAPNFPQYFPPPTASTPPSKPDLLSLNGFFPKTINNNRLPLPPAAVSNSPTEPLFVPSTKSRPAIQKPTTWAASLALPVNSPSPPSSLLNTPSSMNASNNGASTTHTPKHAIGRKLPSQKPTSQKSGARSPGSKSDAQRFEDVKGEVILEIRGESSMARRGSSPDKPIANGGTKEAPFSSHLLIQELLEDRQSVDNFAHALEKMTAEHRMEMVRDMADQLKRAVTLLTFSSSISTQLDLDKGAEKVSHQVCEILQADRASLYLLDESKGELCSKSSRWSDKGRVQSTPEIRISLQSGIAGHVARSGETLNVENAYHSPHFFADVDRHTGYRTRSVLCMPITDMETGKVVAVLEAINKRRRKPSSKERHPIEGFDDEDIQVMKTLAHYAGISLRNAQMYHESQESRNRVKVLLEVASQLASELDTTTLITVIMTKSRQLLDADRCTLFLLDKERGELWSKVADGAKEIRIPSNKGIAGNVVTTGEVLNIKDAYQDSRFNPEVDRKTGYLTKTILCMPLRNNKQEIIGVTQMINKKDGGVFTTQDEQLLQAFSAQAAVAIENSKLFQRTLEMRNYLQSLLQSITNLVLSLDLEGRLVSTNRSVESIFGVKEEQMKKEVFREWLGEKNIQLINHISKVYKDPTHPIENTGYELIVNGTSVHINYSVVPLIVADVKTSATGTVQGVVLVIEDVTHQKRMISTLNRYMSPALAEQVIKQGGDALGGVHVTVTTLFSDIRNFTSMSENLDAKEVVAMLNEYFSHMVGVVFDEQGVIDKYIGDAMMAVFGIPFPPEDGIQDALSACRAALEMLRRLKRFNHKRASRGEAPISIGIGINTGQVVSGNIGSDKRLEYTVIGDGVNLASRMEGVTKVYGVKVLLTEFTNKKVKSQFVTRELDSIRVVGKQHPVRIYELLSQKGKEHEIDSLIDAALKPFAKGLSKYRKGRFDKAIDYFKEAHEASRHTDNPSRIFMLRCEAMINDPPPAPWEGVWDMTSK